MNKKEKELIEKLGNLFLDKTVGKMKYDNSDEEFGALMLVGYQFKKAYPILKELLK